MSKLLLTVLALGMTLATAPAMAKHGADDPAGHEANEHAGGHGADDPAGHIRGGNGADDPAGHVRGGQSNNSGGQRHGRRSTDGSAGHDANEHAAGQDMNDNDDGVGHQ